MHIYKYFDNYILKTNKNISPYNGISKLCKQHLNSILYIIIHKLTKMSIKIMKLANKKVLTEKNLNNAIKCYMKGELLNNTISESVRALNNYNNSKVDTNKGLSKQTKALIIFSPTIIENIIRSYNISISANICLYMASVIEYICAELLDLSSITLRETNNHKRIILRDLYIGISNDFEMNNFLNKLNIKIIGCGVNPYIHPKLLIKKTFKSFKSCKSVKNSKKSLNKRRFKPGTLALKQIKKEQKKSDSLVICKRPFQNIVRNILHKYNNIKISKNVFLILQYYIEQYIIDILKISGFASIHAKRTKLIADDLMFICKLKNIDIE